MDGKHRGTGSTSAAREVHRGKENRGKRVNIVEEEEEEEGEKEERARGDNKREKEE